MKKVMKKKILYGSAMLGCVAAAPVYAITSTAGGTFSTTNQSEWSGGPATVLNYTSGTIGPSINGSASAGGTTTSFFGGHYGAEAGLSLSGSLGLQLKASLNSGSVNASVPFSATITAPNTVFIPDTGGSFSPAASIGLGAGQLQVFAPTAQAALNLNASINASGFAKICFIGCTSTSGTIVNASGSLPLISVNQGNNGLVEVFGVPTPVGLTGSAGPVSWAVVGPQNTPVGTGPAGTATTGASTDVVHLGLDVAALVGDALGVPLSGSIGGVINWTLLSATATLDNYLEQNFGLEDPLVVADLHVVQTGQNDLCTEALGCGPINIPNGFKGGELTIDPSYMFDALFSNSTDLEIMPGFDLSILSACISALGCIGPAFSYDQMFGTPEIGLYNNTFDLEGWNTIEGAPFDVYVFVPEPGTLTLTGLALGLLGLGFARRRRKT